MSVSVPEFSRPSSGQQAPRFWPSNQIPQWVRSLGPKVSMWTFRRSRAGTGRTASFGSRASWGTEASPEASANSTTAESVRKVEPVEHPALTQLRDAGFAPNETTFVDGLHFSRHEWLSMVFTYSAQLTMDPVKRAVLREEMSAEIPKDGHDARNEALLVLVGA